MTRRQAAQNANAARWRNGGQFRDLIAAMAMEPEPRGFPVRVSDPRRDNVRGKIILEGARHGIRLGTSWMKDGRVLVFRKPREEKHGIRS